MPTSWSRRSRAPTISVADGSSDTIRIAPVYPGPLTWPLSSDPGIESARRIRPGANSNIGRSGRLGGLDESASAVLVGVPESVDLGPLRPLGRQGVLGEDRSEEHTS